MFIKENWKVFKFFWESEKIFREEKFWNFTKNKELKRNAINMTIADSLNQLKMEMHMQRQNEFLMYGYESPNYEIFFCLAWFFISRDVYAKKSEVQFIHLRIILELHKERKEVIIHFEYIIHILRDKLKNTAPTQTYTPLSCAVVFA